MYGCENRFKVNGIAKTIAGHMCYLLCLGYAVWQWRQGYDVISHANVRTVI